MKLLFTLVAREGTTRSLTGVFFAGSPVVYLGILSMLLLSRDERVW